MIGMALSVAATAKVVKYLVEIALSVAAKVEEYLVGIDLSVVAAKVVEYLVGIALSLSVVAAKVVEYLVEIALSVAAKVEEYLVGIDLSVVAAKVVEYLVGIALALSVVAAKVVEYLVGIALALSVVAAKVVEYLVGIAVAFVAGIALTVVAKKVGESFAKKVVDYFAKKVEKYLAGIARSVAAKVVECLVAPIARPFRYIWNYKTNFDNFKTEETWIPSYKGFMVFESRMSTLKNILDELSNPDVNMVGIYGTGGIGKTTLAKEIAQHAEDKKLFNSVAFAEVAVNPNIEKIQQEIADFLGLRFQGESRTGRARILQERLKQEEKVLLVLDKIWERLNLEDVGIPFRNDHKGCKLLLTARSLDVLSKMDSQRNFKVGFLDKAEAWSLFEKKAGSCDHLQAVAKNVAEACGGLPLAIDSVAVALKAKEEFEWKDALRKLTTPSSSNFEGVAAETYSSIEISYIQLKEEELKSTFLLCCIMEYSRLEALLEYGMGLGIFEGVEAMEDARNRVNTLVRKLKDSSLLLDINNNRISLHDVVRDVGRSIASRDAHMLTVAKNKIPREWVDKDILKNCVGISIHNISKLPEEFECPELQFFYLSTTYEGYCQVPDNFFRGMLRLKVLHLVRLELHSVPNSIRLLVNLRTLHIYDCNLRDVDFIGEFKQLEILRICDSFSSKIKIIPKKMCNLIGLRLLDLSHCSIRNIPPNVLSTFTRLEELHLPADVFRNCKIEWEVEGVNILDELKHLMHLTTLKIGIADANVLPRGCFLLKKLERYEIIIGNIERSPFYRRNGTSRMVQLNLETSSCSDDVQKFLSVLDGRGFPELEYLHVQNSPCFHAVVDCLESESCHHFLSLQSLSLHRVLNLEMIHSYPLKDKADSFRQLRTITVRECNKLKNILSFSTYRALPLLQEVDVSSCDNMEDIFAINRREEDINNIEETDQIEFKHLSSLTLTSLPKLTSFCSINNNKDMLDAPTLLFNQKVSFSSLEVIEISKMDGLEMIWSNQLCNDSFCNLKSLEVTKCNKLLTIFQSNMLERVTGLEYLTICDCDLVEEIFDLQGVDFEDSNSEVESRLQKLVINGLPKLKHIWKMDPQNILSFQKLRSVKIHRCTSLKYLFPVSIAESLLELEQLDVYDCGVEEFVVDDQGEANVAATFVFPRITSLEFNQLPQLKTFYRGVHTLQWQNLKRLTMCGCDKVELFASELFNFQENNEGQHGSSIQPLFIVEKVTFPSLEEIKISKSNNLKILLQKGAKESFCNLKFVEVNRCHELLTIFQFNTLEGLSMPKLLTVTISNCASVEEIFDLQKVNFEESHSRPVTYRLQELDIRRLPKLKHIWKKDPQAELSFEDLPMPKLLNVIYCDSIEEVFDLQMVNFEESPSRAVPCRLQELNLERLPKLKHVWKKDPQAKLSFEELPMPESLRVNDCYSIEEIFDLQKVNFEESHSRPVTYRLQELDIRRLPKLKHIWKKDPQAELSFENLQGVYVSNCQSLKDIFPASIARSLLQLVHLNVYGCVKLEEIIAKEEEAKEAARFVFPKVTSITLSNLPQLRTFYRGVHSSKWEVLKELKVVGFDKIELLASQSPWFQENNIEECNIDISVQPPFFLVEKLVPSSTSFQNLAVLKVWFCNGLKNLMTSSTAKRLVQLREMAIGSCKSMIEVVAKEGDVTEDKIIFSKLRTLTLGYLPSLSCFCSENYTFELPSLEEIIVDTCPEMKYFSLGDITTPILQKVRRGSKNYYTLEGDLNTTVQKTQRVHDCWDLEMELYFRTLIFPEF